MRIIAGELGGRRIAGPEGDATRPMLDRVREALFARLDPRLAGARVLDLFAGSGSLGLESLSRGAAHVRFVERERSALDALQRNVESLAVRDRARIWRGDALRAQSWRDRGGERYDLVFFDPPYKLVTNPDTSPGLVRALSTLLADDLATGGVIVVHAPVRSVEILRPGREPGWEVHEYGTSAIAFLSGSRAAPEGGEQPG